MTLKDGGYWVANFWASTVNVGAYMGVSEIGVTLFGGSL